MREADVKPINLCTMRYNSLSIYVNYLWFSAFIDIETPATEGMLVMNWRNTAFIFFIQYFLKDVVLKLPTIISTTLHHSNESSRNTLNIHRIVLANVNISLVAPWHSYGKCHSYAWHHWHILIMMRIIFLDIARMLNTASAQKYLLLN